MCLQGKTQGDLQQLLCNPGIARAVHAIVHQHAATVPAFKKLRLGDVSRRLSATAEKLRLVQSCSSRIVLRSAGEDVTAASNGYQVSFAGLRAWSEGGLPLTAVWTSQK